MTKSEQNAATRAKYQQMWDVTADVIRKWDPYELLAGGAPADEWESEISSVVAQIANVHSPADAAEVIARVFGASFEHDAFKPEACSQVGAELYSRLQERGLIR